MQHVEDLGARILTMDSDGNCLFRALADQLRGRPEDHGEIRQHVIDFIEAHETDFAPFVEDDEKFSDYVHRMRNEGEWGGQQEICAASRCFHVNVVIHQLDCPRFEILFKASAPTIHLSFHGASHYNSIRAWDDPCRMGDPAKPFLALTALPLSTSKTSTLTSFSSSPSLAPHRREGKSIPGAEIKERGDEDDELRRKTRKEMADISDESDGSIDRDEPRATEEKVLKRGGQCPCRSGKKWRKCCRKVERQRQRHIHHMNGYNAMRHEQVHEEHVKNGIGEEKLAVRLAAISL